MRNRLLACVALATVLLAAACGSSSKDNSTAASGPVGGAGTSTSAAAATTAATTATSSSGADEAYGGYAAPSPTTAAATATTAAAAGHAAGTVAVASTKLGSVLVDGNGMTLYAYMKDTQGQPSVCAGACAVSWPPLEAGAATAGAGIDAAKLSTIARPDGSTQVAYNGWPLYGYAKDVGPGDVTGQGVGTVWYVMDAGGNVLKG